MKALVTRKSRIVMGVLFVVLATAVYPGLAQGEFQQSVCGQTITEDVTLTQDIGPCSGPGIIVGADGITIDGEGYRILGNGTGDGVVIVGAKPPDTTMMCGATALISPYATRSICVYCHALGPSGHSSARFGSLCTSIASTPIPASSAARWRTLALKALYRLCSGSIVIQSRRTRGRLSSATWYPNHALIVAAGG